MFGNGMYNPYFFNSGISSSGIKGLFSKLNISSFLNTTSKTLNVINQAIPIYNQVKPMIGNAKTMFKVLASLKDEDKPKNPKIYNDTIKTNKDYKNNNSTNNGPTFFI